MVNGIYISLQLHFTSVTPEVRYLLLYWFSSKLNFISFS